MLSPKSQKILNGYFNLPFTGIEGVRCPYFNNARSNQRAQLKVLVGKGTPDEIIEEAKIISIQYHAGLFDKSGCCCSHNAHTGVKVSSDDVRKFLIDNKLGIECSGFVTNVLRAHFKEMNNVDIARKFYITSPKNIVRWLISKLRPVENIGVSKYADDRNTTEVKLDDAKVGDVIVMLETGPQNKRNHILLITEKIGDVIKYSHARAWNSEGQYGHGVSSGEIKILNHGGNLLEQTWTEFEKTNEENETYLEAKNARVLMLRRIKL